MILFLLSAFFTSGHSQVVTYSKIDSIQMDVNKLKTNVDKFRIANRSSHFFSIAGAALYSVGAFDQKLSQSDRNICFVLGGLSMFTGGIFYLDSFKYLNPNYKKRVPKKNTGDFY